MKNRIYKFRAWDKEEKKWAKMNLSNWGKWQGAGMCQIYKKGEPDVFEHNSCDRYVWQQFTGLKDRNKKEIYEDDILNYWQPAIDKPTINHSMKKVVKFENGAFNVRRTKNYEVIGNIYEKGKELQDDRGDDSGKYENPELLK